MPLGVLQPRFGHVAYCGAPPEPSTLLLRWNLDPRLLTVLLALLLIYIFAFRRADRPSPVALWRQACFYAGWVVAAGALVSPLCALSVSLFSARIGQHMILETIAAPLVALGLPARLSAAPRRLSAQPWELLAAAAFAGALWFWHAPAAYAASFHSDVVYWLMHISSFGAALWLWRTALAAQARRLGGFLAAMFATTLQMGFLGALLTFASGPFYAVHALTTETWGLSPLQDQQLGGIIMWVPAGAIFLTAIVTGTAAALHRSTPSPLALARS